MIEVFHADANQCHDWNAHHDEDPDAHKYEPGWYWWGCFPGCMPDSEPMGAFETASEALLDAYEGEAMPVGRHEALDHYSKSFTGGYFNLGKLPTPVQFLRDTDGEIIAHFISLLEDEELRPVFTLEGGDGADHTAILEDMPMVTDEDELKEIVAEVEKNIGGDVFIMPDLCTVCDNTATGICEQETTYSPTGITRFRYCEPCVARSNVFRQRNGFGPWAFIPDKA